MNDITVNELIEIGFKNAYSSFHDERFIYNLHKNGLLIQWDSKWENEVMVSREKEEMGTSIPIDGIDHLKRIVSALFNSEPNPEWSVATKV